MGRSVCRANICSAFGVDRCSVIGGDRRSVIGTVTGTEAVEAGTDAIETGRVADPLKIKIIYKYICKMYILADIFVKL